VIDRVSNYGKVTIKFSEVMSFPANLVDTIERMKDTDNPVMTLEMEAGVASDDSKLGFTWEIIGFEDDEMYIQLYFENPV